MHNSPEILHTVGNTPFIFLEKYQENATEIFVKLENSNPLSSVKDRIALAMISYAEERRYITKNTPVIEATSGNTGIGLAFVCAAKGYSLTLTMPESMSLERRNLLKALGAHLVLTPAKEGMAGAVNKAQELVQTMCGFMPDQFANPANPAAHENGTAQEIWAQSRGEVDVFVAGIGTGGTISGVARGLKKYNPQILAVGLEPEESPLLSQGRSGAHVIQGIGTNFIPENLDRAVVDQILSVPGEAALNTARDLVRNNGIFCGISSGANVWAARKLANDAKYFGKRIVTLICDTGERYLSTTLFTLQDNS